MGYDINTDDNMSAEVVAQSTHMDATRQQPPGMDATPLSAHTNMGAYGGFPHPDTKIDLLSPPVSGNYNRSNNHWTNKLQFNTLDATFNGSARWPLMPSGTNVFNYISFDTESLDIDDMNAVKSPPYGPMTSDDFRPTEMEADDPMFSNMEAD